MINPARRNPKYYNGTRPTAHQIRDILPTLLSDIQTRHADRPDLILAAWPSIIGEKLAPMTKAVAFQDGTLTVIVRNTTLYSLLNHHEKNKILKRLNDTFPNAGISNIAFRIG